MNLIQYELFASVAQTLNVSKTAQQFYITQPAVSHHIKSLENTLGVELVKRTKRGVYLTEAGEEFLPYVREILAINSRAETRMRSIADGMVSQIKLAVLSSSTRIVSKCLVKFSETNPDVQVDISLLDGEAMVNALKDNEFDIYFALNKMSPVDANYEELILNDETLSLYVNKSLADKMGDTIDWNELNNHPLISVPRTDMSLFGKINRICRNHDYTPRITNTYNRAEATILSVSAGLGVAILPSAIGDLYNWSDVIAYQIDDPDAKSPISCIWDPGKITTADRHFLDTVRDVIS